VRWTPSGHQLADGLTKDTGDAADALRAALSQSKYNISDEATVLARRAELKAQRLAKGKASLIK